MVNDNAIPSRAITVRQWLDLGRLVTHNARVHQMRREIKERGAAHQAVVALVIASPCPFCGVPPYVEDNGGNCRITCHNCEPGPSVNVGADDMDQHNRSGYRAHAIKLWNTREKL